MSDASAPEEEAAPEPQQELLHDWPVTDSHGQRVVHCDQDGYLPLITALKGDGYEFCSDITAVDYLNHAERVLPEGVTRQRFEVVVNLVSLEDRSRIRIRCQVAEDNPVLPTLFGLWPGTEAPEREVFDLMGIRFDDHPDLTRILMPEDWEGHPLRKDYAVGRIPVQFKDAPQPR